MFFQEWERWKKWAYLKYYDIKERKYSSINLGGAHVYLFIKEVRRTI